MKNLIYLLLAVLMLSCSDDDQVQTEKEIPADKRFVSAIETSFGPIKFDYNANNYIKEISVMNVDFYQFEYEGSNVKILTHQRGNDIKEYVFSYDDNGKIASMTVNGVTVPIVYNAAQNSYNNAIFLNEHGDIKKFESEGKVSTYLYDTETKGVYTNTNNVNVHLLLAEIGGFFPVLCSNQVISRYNTDDAFITTLSTEVDLQGFPMKLALDFLEQDDFTAAYSYVER